MEEKSTNKTFVKQFFDQFDWGIVGFDEQFQLIDWNLAITNSSNEAIDGFLQTPLTELLNLDKDTFACISRNLKNGHSQNLEAHVQLGAINNWYEVTLYPFMKEENFQGGYLTFDVQLAENNESNLLNSDSFSRAYDQIQASILITDGYLDEPGPYIVYVNPAFTHITGYKKDEIIGKNLRILYGAKTDKDSMEDLRYKLAHGQNFSGEAINYRKDGSEFIMHWEMTPLKDDLGTITNYIAVQRDVTQEQNLKELLEETQQILKAGGWSYHIQTASSSFTKEIYEIYGIDYNEELDKEKAIAYYDPEHQPIIRKAFDDLLQKGEPFDKELKFWRSQNERLWVRATGRPYYNRDQLYKIGGTLHDITNEKESQLERDLLFNNITGLVAIVDNGYLGQVNSRWIQLLGWSEEELKAVPLIEFVHSEDREQTEAMFTKLYESGGISSCENRFQCFDGNYCWLSWNVTKDPENDLIYALVRDVHDSRDMEMQLRESEETFRNLVERSFVGVFMIKNYHAEYVNPKMTEITGYSREELLYEFTPLDTIHPEDYNLVKQKIKARLTGEEHTLQYEFRIVTKYGYTRNVEVFSSRFLQRGEPIIIGSMLDITERKQAEEQLLEHKHFIEKITLTSPNLISVVDYQKGEYVYGNNRTLDFIGYSFEEINQFDNLIIDLLHPDDVDQANQIVHKNSELKDGATNSIEFRLKAKNGEYRWFSSLDTPFKRDEKGNVVQVLSTVQDITEQKEAQQEIIEKQKFIEGIAQNSPNTIYLYNLKEEKGVYTNNYIISKLGHSWNEIDKLPNGIMDLIHPDDRQSVQKVKEKVKASNDGEVIDNEYRIQDKNGKWRWLFNRDTIFSRDEKGRVTETIGIVHDITERKNAEESLKRNEALFRQLFQNAPVGIVILDEAYVIQNTNEGFREIFEYTAYEAIGEQLNNLIVPEYCKEEAGTISRQTMMGETQQMETVRMDKHGNYVPVFLYGVPVFFEGKTINIFGIYVDISERKQVEQDLKKQTNELLRSNAELEQFAYVTSHNLRSPVVNLQSLVGFFDDSDLDNDENKFVFNKINKSVEQLNDTLNDLVEIVGKKKELSRPKEKIQFQEMMEKVKNSLEHEIDQYNAQITVDFSGAPQIYYLRSFLESILQNLLSNALKYSSPDRKPVITINTIRKNGYVLLTFSDNGRGIDLEKHREKLFSLYKRFHMDKTGKGMGLYLLKSQVESLGGEVNIDSKVDMGTTFYLYLKNFYTKG